MTDFFINLLRNIMIVQCTSHTITLCQILGEYLSLTIVSKPLDNKNYCLQEGIYDEQFPSIKKNSQRNLDIQS